MEDIATIANIEIQKLESNLNSLRREIDDRLQRQQGIQREIEAWKTIVEARSGKIATSVNSSETGVYGHYEPNFFVSSKTDNKTDFVRKTFQDAGSLGLVASDLVEKLKEAGIGGHRSFPYTAISKMKSRGEIYEAYGRYFWKQPNLNLEVKEQEPTEVGS